MKEMKRKLLVEYFNLTVRRHKGRRTIFNCSNSNTENFIETQIINFHL